MGEQAFENPDAFQALNSARGFNTHANELRAQVRAKSMLLLLDKKVGLYIICSHDLYYYTYDHTAAFQEEYGEFEALYKPSQAIQEGVLGSEHPDVTQSLINRVRGCST